MFIRYLETFPFRSDEVFEEVVEHGRDPVDHGRVKKDEPDLAGQFVQHLDRLQTHDVVVPSKSTRVVILREFFLFSCFKVIFIITTFLSISM